MPASTENLASIQDSEEQTLIPKSPAPRSNPFTKLKQKFFGPKKRTFSDAEKARITSRARREPLDALFEEYYGRKPNSEFEYRTWAEDVEKWCQLVDANAKRAFVSPLRNFIHKAGAAVIGFGSGVGAGITISAFIFCTVTGISFSVAATPLVVLVPAGIAVGVIGALVGFYGASMIKTVATKVSDYRAAKKLERKEQEYAETHDRTPTQSFTEIAHLLKQTEQQIKTQEQLIQQVEEAAKRGAKEAVDEGVGKFFYDGSKNWQSVKMAQAIKIAKTEQPGASAESPSNGIS